MPDGAAMIVVVNGLGAAAAVAAGAGCRQQSATQAPLDSAMETLAGKLGEVEAPVSPRERAVPG